MDWLFFDIGSTLVDESLALDDFINRCILVLNKEGIVVSKEEYCNLIYCIAAKGGDAIREAWQYFAPSFLERPKWSHYLERLYPDVKSLLQQLSQNFHLAVIANQDKNLKKRLEIFGILDEFEILVSSTEVGLYKPDIRIFQYALEQAGIQPSRAIYIGDRVDNDIIPAKKLGMRTVRILQGMGQYACEDVHYASDWQVSCLNDILELSKKGFV